MLALVHGHCVECHKGEKPPSEQSKLHFQSSGLRFAHTGVKSSNQVSDVIQDSPRPQNTSVTQFSKSRRVWKCLSCCLDFLLEVNFSHRSKNGWGSNIQWNGYSRKRREERGKEKNNSGILESRASKEAHKIGQRASMTLGFEAEYPRKAWLSCLCLVVWAKIFSDRNKMETQTLTSQLYFPKLWLRISKGAGAKLLWF